MDDCRRISKRYDIPPTRENIIKWTWIAMNDLPEQIVQNSWRHCQYSWFPAAPVAEPAIVDAEEAEPVVSEEIDVEEESEEEESDKNADSTVVQFILYVCFYVITILLTLRISSIAIIIGNVVFFVTVVTEICVHLCSSCCVSDF
jgi:hypothetical protein